MTKILLLSLLLGLVGCQRLSKPPVASPSNTPTAIGNASEAVARLSASNREIEVASAKRESAISAFLDVALELVGTQPISPSISAIRALVELARSTSLQPPDLVKLAAAQQLAQLHTTGMAVAAKTEQEKLNNEARAAATQDAELKATREKMEQALSARIADLEKERAESLRKNQEAMNTLTAEVNDLKSGHTKNLQIWTARILIGLGIAGIVGSGAMIWLSFSVNPLSAVTRSIPLILGSLLSIGCGFIVAEPWFIWAVGITIVIFLAGLAAVLWHGRKTTKTLATTLRKTIQSTEEQQLENPAAALDFKEYQQDNLDDAEKELVDDLKPTINRSYIDKVQKSKAVAAFASTNPPIPAP